MAEGLFRGSKKNGEKQALQLLKNVYEDMVEEGVVEGGVLLIGLELNMDSYFH